MWWHYTKHFFFVMFKYSVIFRSEFHIMNGRNGILALIGNAEFIREVSKC